MSEPTKQYPDNNKEVPGFSGSGKYVLQLFVSGMLHNSVNAIRNIKQICEHHLKDEYELEIIDIYQQPGMAISEQVIVIPVMIIKHPLPERRLIGDLSNTKKVLEFLNIK